MKAIIKIYLEPAEAERLKQKASASGFTGRGSISHYIQKISNESIIFLDDNAQTLLQALKLKTGTK